MSATIEQAPDTLKPPTDTQRGVDATTQLRMIFGFSNLKAMSTAIAEAAVIEAQSNPAFAERVRKVYQELVNTAGKSKASPRTPRPAQKKSTLRPIARVEGYDIDPFAALDPYLLYKMYGAEQFPLALDEQTLAGLKQAVEKLMSDNPGTKPKTKSKKADVIDYIVEIVTGSK